MELFCLGFVFNEDNTRVLLQRKSKPDRQVGRFNGIGGKIEKSEQPLQAMIREGEEEIGATLEWIPKFIMQVGDDVYVTVYKATATKAVFDTAEKYSTEKTTEPCLAVDVEFVPSIANDKILTNLKWMVPLLADAKFAGSPLIGMSERS